jgi:hypothetical protein
MTIAIDDFFAASGHTYPDQIRDGSMLPCTLPYEARKSRPDNLQQGNQPRWLVEVYEVPVKEIIAENPTTTEKESRYTTARR